MSLASTIRKVVKVADKLTKSFQEEVEHHVWIGADGYGAPLMPQPIIKRQALVERQLRTIMSGGKLVEVKTKITFLEEIEPNGAVGRIEPIDPKDKLVLPDGETGPMFRQDGMHDAGTGRPFLLEVYLGVKL